MKYFFSTLAIFLVSITYSQVDLSNTYEESPIRFIENKGQFGKTLSQKENIRYAVEGKRILLRDDGITFFVSDEVEQRHEAHEEMEEMEEEGTIPFHMTEPQVEAEIYAKKIVTTRRLKMSFLHPSSNMKVEELGMTDDYLNFYLATCPDGVTDVHLFRQVKYTEVYADIDAFFYGNATGDLKYDFVVKPGGNPKKIRMKWEGADKVRINSSGELCVQTQVGELKEARPYAYQIVGRDTVSVPVAFSLKEKRNGEAIVSFELGQYDSKLPLVIDPWVTNFGGESFDLASCLSEDLENGVYMGGTTSSYTWVFHEGFQEEKGGEQDGFIAHFNEAGERLWATYLGGENIEYLEEIDTDSFGNLVVTGFTASQEGIGSDGLHNTKYTTGYDLDAFLVKLSSTGERLWGTYYGGSGVDAGFAVSFDPDGNIYFGGSTSSLEEIAYEGFQESFLGFSPTSFLVKLSPDCDLIWGTYYGGESHNVVNGITCDLEGNVIIGGYNGGGFTEYFYDAGFDSITLSTEGYLAKFTPEGDRIWGSLVGGGANDAVADVETDLEGNIYVCGYTHSIDNIAQDGFDSTHAAILSKDAFLMKINADGERAWGTYYGGGDNDYALSCDVDPSTGNVVISGDSYSIDLPNSPCSLQPSLSGTENGFLGQFLPDGRLYCSSYFGLDHEEDSKVCFSGCYVYICGRSPIDVATPGAFQEEFGGASDAYLAQVYKGSCGLSTPTSYLDGSTTSSTTCDPCNGSATVSIVTESCTGNVSYVDYIWSTGDTIFQSLDTSSTLVDLCPGEYWVKVIQNCNEEEIITLTVASEVEYPEADFTVEDGCEGELISFENTSSEEGEMTFYWELGDDSESDEENPEHTYDTPGTYDVSLLVRDSIGCADSITQSVQVHPFYEVEEIYEVCGDTTITLDDGSTTNISENFSSTETLFSSFGCDSIVTRSFIVHPEYNVEETIELTSGETYVFPDGSSMIITEPGYHTSELQTIEGCDSIIVTHFMLENENFIPPNIFTPNEDGANNTFFFPYSPNIMSFQCIIVNRWGKQMFAFSSIEDEWDGSNQANGKPCPDGVYFYTYEGIYSDGESFSGQGTVQLVRP